MAFFICGTEVRRGLTPDFLGFRYLLSVRLVLVFRGISDRAATLRD
jgi:hypothetical protein